MATFPVDIVVSTPGAQQLAPLNRQLDQTDRAATGAASASRALSTAIASVVTVSSATTILRVADNYTKVRNSIVNVVSSTEELTQRTTDLLKISNQSRSSLESTAELYSKLTRATSDLGLSTERVLRITDLINKGFIASGAGAQEASNAITQLAQGLSAGALRGDEFNSVAEQAPVILRAVAAETGKTIGQLREFAATGGITAELLVTAIENYGETVEREFGKTTVTLQQQLVVARNLGTEFIGSSEAVQSASASIGQAAVTVAENLDVVLNVATAVAAVMAGRLVASAGVATAAFVSKTQATLASIKTDQIYAAQIVRSAAAEKQAALAVVSLASAQFQAAKNTNAHTLALNAQLAAQTRAATAVGAYNAAVAAQAALATRASVAIGALGRALTFIGGPVGVVLLAATAFTTFSEKAKTATDATSVLNLELEKLTRNQAAAAIIKLGDELSPIQAEIEKTERAIAVLQRTLEKPPLSSASYLKTITDGLTRQQGKLDGLNQQFDQYNNRLKALQAVANPAAKAVTKVTETVDANFQTLRTVGAELDKLFSGDVNLFGNIPEQTTSATQAIDDQVAVLARQLVALQLTGEQQAVYNATSGLAAEATDAQRQQIEALTAAIYRRQEALRAEQAITQFDQSLESPEQRLEREAQLVRDANAMAIQSQEEFAARELAITAKLAADKLRITQASQSAIRVATAQGLDALAGIVEAAGGKQTKAYRAIYAASRAFALADSIAKITQASAQALADPTAVTLPQKFANYAAVATAGAGLINALKPQQFADGGPVSGAGTGRSDSIPAMLSNGEYVMTAQRTAQYRSELDAMRRGTFSANSGGVVVKSTVINNVSDMVTATQTQGPDGELLTIIDRRIAEQVPGVVEQQLADPYSGSTRALNSAYRMERR